MFRIFRGCILLKIFNLQLSDSVDVADLRHGHQLALLISCPLATLHLKWHHHYFYYCNCTIRSAYLYLIPHQVGGPCPPAGTLQPPVVPLHKVALLSDRCVHPEFK